MMGLDMSEENYLTDEELEAWSSVMLRRYPELEFTINRFISDVKKIQDFINE